MCFLGKIKVVLYARGVESGTRHVSSWGRKKTWLKSSLFLLYTFMEESPGGGHGNPLQYSCLENPHGQRSLVGYSPWGYKELDTTKRLSTAQHMKESRCWISYVQLSPVWIKSKGKRPVSLPFTNYTAEGMWASDQWSGTEAPGSRGQGPGAQGCTRTNFPRDT